MRPAMYLLVVICNYVLNRKVPQKSNSTNIVVCQDQNTKFASSDWAISTR